MYYNVGFIVGIFVTLLGGMVIIFLKPRASEARMWALLSLCVSIWYLGRWMVLHSLSSHEAFFWQRVLYTGAIPLNIVYCHFIFTYLNYERFKKLIWLGYWIALINIVVNWTSQLFVREMAAETVLGFYERPSTFYFLHLLSFLFYPTLGVIELFRARSRVNHLERNRIDYVLAASVLGFLCGCTSFPLVWDLPVPPVGTPLVFIYVLLIAYAIVRHQLMDIRLVIKTTLLYSILSAFLAAIYVGAIMAVARFMDGYVGTTSKYASVIGALVVVILVRPLQLKVNYWLDRHFSRESLDQTLLRETTGHFAHEIKRPLVNISMPAQLAISDVDQLVRKGLVKLGDVVALKERLSFILHQSHEAADKIEAIRELSLDQDVPKKPVDLIEVLNLCIQNEQDRIAKYAIQIKKELTVSIATVQGSMKQLEIALTNIIRNAIDSMHAISLERKLGCRVSKELNQYVITISDTGHGIRPEDQGRLFHPWFSTKGSKGMGIGLYLTQQIIRRHRGEVKVTSTPGVGTTFTVQLPVN